jgi:outer membrane protein TolC
VSERTTGGPGEMDSRRRAEEALRALHEPDLEDGIPELTDEELAELNNDPMHTGDPYSTALKEPDPELAMAEEGLAQARLLEARAQHEADVETARQQVEAVTGQPRRFVEASPRERFLPGEAAGIMTELELNRARIHHALHAVEHGGFEGVEVVTIGEGLQSLAGNEEE